MCIFADEKVIIIDRRGFFDLFFDPFIVITHSNWHKWFSWILILILKFILKKKNVKINSITTIWTRERVFQSSRFFIPGFKWDQRFPEYNPGVADPCFYQGSAMKKIDLHLNEISSKKPGFRFLKGSRPLILTENSTYVYLLNER